VATGRRRRLRPGLGGRGRSVSPRTSPLVALDDRSYWRRLLATVHPDRNDGDRELFVFLTALREHVEECGEGPSPRLHRTGPYWTGGEDDRTGGPERIPFDEQLGYVDEFLVLTHRALSIRKREEEPYRSLLALLLDCPATDHGRRAERQCRGASYKQLAAIGHMVPLNKAERCRWYEIARSVPLSDAHASHILGELKRQAAA
jgi:hypothetical protein